MQNDNYLSLIAMCPWMKETLKHDALLCAKLWIYKKHGYMDISKDYACDLIMCESWVGFKRSCFVLWHCGKQKENCPTWINSPPFNCVFRLYSTFLFLEEDAFTSTVLAKWGPYATPGHLILLYNPQHGVFCRNWIYFFLIQEFSKTKLMGLKKVVEILTVMASHKFAHLPFTTKILSLSVWISK